MMLSSKGYYSATCLQRIRTGDIFAWHVVKTLTLQGAASSMIAMSNVSIEDIEYLRLASEKKFANIWKEEKDDVWESYL
jgi:hypothetical protein